MAGRTPSLAASYTPFMWLITPVGFFSILRKRGETDLTVRARVRDDLEALEEEYLPFLGPIIAGGGTDYPYRAHVDPIALAAVIARMVEEIDYSNFKDTVAARQGFERAHVYGEVWSALHKLTPKTEP
jgi:hypothetical protein